MAEYAYKINEDGVTCAVTAVRDEIPADFMELPADVNGNRPVYWDGAGPTNTKPAAVVAEEERAVITSQLAALDSDMPRGTEDVIDALVAKGVIALADLPQEAQDKKAQKQSLRAQLI